MRRTQLYIDDDLWEALRIRSEQAETSISELVRRAVREKYTTDVGYRRQAMQALAGIWRDRVDLRDAEDYVRRLRRGSRRKRMH